MTTPSCVFIYGNLKVSPFLPNDAPIPGFELVTYERESYVPGTLWDTGRDAGFTRIGNGIVYGQLWRITDPIKLDDLFLFTGVKSGILETIIIPIEVNVDNHKSEIEALTFSLTQIKKEYTIIQDGYWSIKRERI